MGLEFQHLPPTVSVRSFLLFYHYGIEWIYPIPVSIRNSIRWNEPRHLSFEILVGSSVNAIDVERPP
jgi:hypothetical protein